MKIIPRAFNRVTLVGEKEFEVDIFDLSGGGFQVAILGKKKNGDIKEIIKDVRIGLNGNVEVRK